MSTKDDLLDHTPLTFGKYQGKTPDQVSDFDPGYVIWVYDNVTDKPTCSKLLADACRQDDDDESDEEDRAPWER